MRKNEKGFTGLEVVLILVVLVAVGFAGFMVYKNRSKASNNSTPASSNQQKTEATPKEEAKNSLGLTQADKDKVAASVLAFCQKASPGTNFKIVGAENLDNPKQTKVKDNFVISNLYCYDNSLPQEQQGSGSNYLLKKVSSDWTTISADQMTPACSKVDGYGVPAGFIQCYGEGDQVRDPH